MATIGVSKPYCAKYNYDETTRQITYTDGDVMGKMTEVDLTINTSDGNNLYGDNGIAETDKQFSDGSVTVGTTDLSQDTSKLILGAKEVELEKIPGVEDEGVKELIFDDDLSQPYLGQGYIIKKQVNNKVKWRAVVLTKTMFDVPDDAATTQEEQIEWQTPSLTATVLRDDSEKHTWKREATFTTEAQAEAYIRYRLNIPDTPASDSGTTPGGGAEDVQPTSYSSRKAAEKV